MKLRIQSADVGAVYGDPVYLAANDLETVDACPACTAASDQQEISAAEGSQGRGLALARCSRCSHVYLSRRPNQDWFQRYYSSEWDSGRLVQKTRATERLRSFLARSRRLQRWVSATRVLRTGLQRQVTLRTQEARMLSMVAGIGDSKDFNRIRLPAKLLEIGCGHGASLVAFREAGFDVYGTEASAHRVDLCRAKGLRVEQTDIVDFAAIAPHAPFDVVYSAHVFEHLTDLEAFMTRLTPLVKPGGMIYVEVPHSHVTEHILHRTHVPVHCHLFSARSLATLLHRFGFDVARVLLDMNLHIVAVNQHVPAEFPAVHVDTEPDALARGLQVMRPEHGALRIDYDHYRMAISRADNGTVLSERPRVSGTAQLNRPGSDRLVNSFVVTVDREAADDRWPIRFVHETPLPPMWLKRQ